MTRSRGGGVGGGNGGGSLIFVFALATVMIGGSAVVWLAGALGGILRGAGPVVLGPSQATGVLARLPRHLGDPAAAWPASSRGDLPGRTGMTAALTAALAAVVVLAVAVFAVVGRARRGGHGGRRRGARWARRGDLRELRVRRPQRGRVILGRHEGALVAAEPRASVMVVAPAQAGKTTGLVVPALLEWDGPVLATSVKGDLTHDTYAARSLQGDVRIFDPTGSTGLPSTGWSPVAASTSWEAARRTAARLLQVGERGGNSPDESFWRPAAARYLAPLLLAAAHERATMGDVLSWIARTEQQIPHEALHSSSVLGARAGLDALQSVWDADERFRSSVLQTAATALDAWEEPRVAAATDTTATIDAQWLLSGRNTLYLVAPAQDQRRLRGLFAALVADVVASAFDRSTATGRAIDPPLLLCLDEAANVAPLPNLDELASTGPGQGVQLLSVFQNISQISDRWGRDRAETIVANHRARLFGSGIGDRATLEYLRAVLGEEEIERVSTHRQRLELDLGSRTTSHDYKPLAAPNHVRQADNDTALLIYGRLPPAWLQLRPWYRDRALKRLVNATGNARTPATLAPAAVAAPEEFA